MSVNWIGAWSATRAYAVGDGVYDLGLWWQAIAANSNARPAANPADWTSAVPAVNWRGQYGAGIPYNLLDAVFANGAGYVALGTVTGSNPTTDMSDWAPFGLAPDYLGAYDPTHLYAPGALASDVDGGLYMLIVAAAQGVQPYQSGAAWSAIWTPYDDEILIDGAVLTVGYTLVLWR